MANRYLNEFVDEVLSLSYDHVSASKPNGAYDSDFHPSSLLTQTIHHHHDAKLTSQVARLNSIWPTHSTEKKKVVVDLCKRLKRNDGGTVKVRLASCGIDDDIIKRISDCLLNNTFLQFLILHNNAITDVGVGHLLYALRRHISVHTLWLGGNLISDKGAEALATLVGANSHIKDLILSNKWPTERWTNLLTDMHPHITSIGAAYFADKLRQGCGLTSLSLADQRILDEGAKLLFQALKPSQLLSLNLSANKLTNECCNYAKVSLVGSPSLEKLVLSHNSISDRGAVLISQGIANNHHLKLLDVSFNQIDGAGMKALFVGVGMSASIRSVCTTGNIVFDDRFNDIHTYKSDTTTWREAAIAEEDEEATPTKTKAFPWATFDAQSVKLPHVDNLGFHGRRPISSPFLVSEDNPLGLHVSRQSPLPPVSPLRTMSRKLSSKDLESIPLSSRAGSASSSNSRQSQKRGSIGSGTERSVDDDMTLSQKSGTPKRRGSGGSHSSKLDAGFDVLDSLRRESHLRDIEVHSSDGSDLDDDSRRAKIDAEKARRRRHYARVSAAKEESASRKHGHGSHRGQADSQHGKLLGKMDSSSKHHDQLVSRIHGTGSKPLFEDESHTSLQQYFKKSFKPKLTKNIGKTMGVPSLGPFGVLPVRVHMNPYADSMDHSMYLRVASADDPEGTQPYPVLKIIQDRQKERDRVKATHSTERFIAVCCYFFVFMFGFIFFSEEKSLTQFQTQSGHSTS